jgi:hypothetical protein
MNARKIPDDVLQSVLLKISSFFLNEPYKKWKKVLWEFYTSTVYYGEQFASGKESSDHLFMYERLIAFLKELHQLNDKMQQYDK